MITKVISAFPGTGKSYYAGTIDSDLKVIDLDSTAYTGGHDAEGKVRNVHFPSNYLKAIEEQLGQADILFISIHKEVIDSLLKEGVRFTLIYPDDSLKDEYIERFKRRNSSEAFINLFMRNWDMSIKQLRDQKGCRHIVLKSNQYISDALGMK